MHLLFDSVVVSGVTTLVALTTALFAAYNFTYLRPKGRGVLILVVPATRMVLFEAILVPEFVIMRDLNVVNTYQAQVLPFAASRFAIFLLVQFMRAVPKELWEAARDDGAKGRQGEWHVLVPILRPALDTVGIYLFLMSWNAFLWPQVVTTGPRFSPSGAASRNFWRRPTARLAGADSRSGLCGSAHAVRFGRVLQLSWLGTARCTQPRPPRSQSCHRHIRKGWNPGGVSSRTTTLSTRSRRRC
jgi:hypothetical protein